MAVPMGEITRALVGVRRRLCVKWGFVDMDVYEQEYRFYYFARCPYEKTDTTFRSIPLTTESFPQKEGGEQLLGTINKVKRQINPKLRIEGILLTMVDSRTNYSKDISNLIRESYGGKLKVYKTDIPRSVRAEEISAEGTSIFKHDPKGKVAEAYKILTKEVLNNAEKRRKHQLEGVR